MSELKREIGGGLIAKFDPDFAAIAVSSDSFSDSVLFFSPSSILALVSFLHQVQTEIASRQRLDDGFNGPDFNQSERLKPLPEIKPITTVLKRLTP